MKTNEELIKEEIEAGKCIVESFPEQLWLQVTTKCNFHPPCIMCQLVHDENRDDSNIREKIGEDIPEEVVQRLKPFMENFKTVELYAGEPFCYLNLIPLIREFPEYTVRLITNGFLINKRNFGEIMDTKMLNLYFSVDAASPEIFFNIRGRVFNKLIEIIKMCVMYKKENHLNTIISISMTLMKKNISDAAAFVDLGKHIGVDEVLFNHLCPGEDWRVERYGFKFDYKEQMLENSPDLSNKHLTEAILRAKELSINTNILQGDLRWFFLE